MGMLPAHLLLLPGHGLPAISAYPVFPFLHHSYEKGRLKFVLYFEKQLLTKCIIAINCQYFVLWQQFPAKYKKTLSVYLLLSNNAV